MDIVETAKNAGNCSKLVKAVEAAGLKETLQGPGPYTVFAPSDQAFEDLPEGSLDELLQDRQRLRAVLTYHVVPGKVRSTEARDMNRAKTVQGQELRLKKEGESLRINDSAKVTQPDIEADNGIIHLIDQVVMPKFEQPPTR